MESGQECVPNDQYILLIDNRKDQRLVKIIDNKNFKWRKTPISLTQITKYPFYTQLQVGNHKLTPTEWDFGEQEEQEQVEVTNNNKEIFTIQEPQHLKTEDIMQMKKELKPQELINGLVQNNQQFSKRTQYSKQKYLKKKERKYMFYFYAEPVCLENIHQYYYSQEARSIGWIRWEMLGSCLLYASPFKRVLLSQQSKGIFLGSIISRGAKRISVANIQKKSMKHFPIVEQLNFTKQQKDQIKFLSWQQIQQDTNSKYDNLIMSGNYDFVQILKVVQPLLQNGANIVFYCLNLQPLQKVARQMKGRSYVNLKLMDSWCRTFQVLKNRTHPLMNMDSCSGFLLHAIKVQ